MSRKEPRQLKELRNLMPFAWDTRKEKHPPGTLHLELTHHIAGLYSSHDCLLTLKLLAETIKFFSCHVSIGMWLVLSGC